MVVEDVVIPRDAAAMPWCLMLVENATGRMRKQTSMSVRNFGTDLASAFLRPAPKVPVKEH
jgi:hypothetical protein